MEKYSILLSICIFVNTYASSKERTQVELDSIANSVFNIEPVNAKLWRKSIKDDKLTLDSICSFALNSRTKPNEDKFKVYTFQSSRPGYVIVSKDDRLPAIIAFSENTTFDADNMPTAMRHLLMYYDEKTTYSEEPEVCTRRESSQSEVAPLLGDIAFSQLSPIMTNAQYRRGYIQLQGVWQLLWLKL